MSGQNTHKGWTNGQTTNLQGHLQVIKNECTVEPAAILQENQIPQNITMVSTHQELTSTQGGQSTQLPSTPQGTKSVQNCTVGQATSLQNKQVPQNGNMSSTHQDPPSAHEAKNRNHTRERTGTNNALGVATEHETWRATPPFRPPNRDPTDQVATTTKPRDASRRHLQGSNRALHT